MVKEHRCVAHGFEAFDQSDFICSARPFNHSIPYHLVTTCDARNQRLRIWILEVERLMYRCCIWRIYCTTLYCAHRWSAENAAKSTSRCAEMLGSFGMIILAYTFQVVRLYLCDKLNLVQSQRNQKKITSSSAVAAKQKAAPNMQYYPHGSIKERSYSVLIAN